MVSFSNGSLSGEVSNKRPLENGCMPKYKPRKVSAVREFPPGCGPNAVPINLRPERNCGSDAGSTDAPGVINFEMTNAVVANGAGTSVMADLVESEAVGNSKMPKIAKLTEIKHSEIQNVVDPKISVECQPREEVGSSSSLAFGHWVGVNGSVDVPETGTLDKLMEKAKENVTESKKLVIEIGPLGTQLPEESEWHRQEGVNNPIEIERDEPLDAYLGKVVTTVINGLTNEVQEVMPEPDLVGVDIPNDEKILNQSGGQTMSEVFKEDNCLSALQNSSVEVARSRLNADASIGKDLLLGNPLEFPAYCGRNQPETSIRPKDKYRPRRVSAVREFPPYCGTNASLPIEKEMEMSTPGKDSLNRTEKVELTPEPSMSTTSGECLDGLHNIHVEIEKSEMLNDGAGRGLLREMTVATAEGGAMEFEEYSGDLQHGITERTGASPGSGTMSTELVNTSIEDARGPVGKEIAVLSPDRNDKDRPPCSDISFGNDFKKELVHGLMAAPYCSWRKSKAALNNPDGGTDGLKMRQQNVPLRQKPKADALNSNLEANPSGCSYLEKTASPDSHDGDETPGKSTFMDEGDHGAGSECIREVTPISMFKADVGSSDNDYVEAVRKDIVVCSPGDSDEGRSSHNAFGSKDDVDREVLHGLMAAPYCPWRKEKTISNSNGGISRGNKRKQNLSWRQKAKAVAKKSNPVQYSGSSSKKKNKVHVSNDVDEGTHALMLPDAGDDDHDGDFATNSPASNKGADFEINLPRFGPTRSGLGDARNRVRAILQLFHAIYRKLLQQEEANPVQGMEGRSKQSGRKVRRNDLLTAQTLKNKGEFVNTTKMIGPVPGVEVGDEFQYRVELAVVGIHFPYQSGIDSVKVKDVPLATSIVASGAYFDDVENADVLRYSGQGGNVIGKSKQPEDQRLERGNLALKNSIAAKTPVRVVRGWKETKFVDPLDAKPKMVTTYVYDGLYTVTNYWTEKGPHGKQVFMFELKRNPGQPELAWKELKKSSKSKIRPGVCVADISGGKERIPICAVNTLDDDKPPPFNYTPKMIYPDWYSPDPPDGCNCTGRCSKSKKCRCAVRNEGDIPYNHNGALVETKPLVYECGPHCKCPPSCYNRVTQRGIKFQLEVFKTDSRGWGVRALTSIPSGSFICEYSGELLEEKIADERIGNDEYLFDVGQNLIDSSSNSEEQAAPAELRVERGYTIDALTFGNVGRFVNHSCLPNLHAQNVIYDNDDKRMPHIMLFAMENIPPLTELTYHYNYSLGQIQDSHGNVKVKKCYCGAAGCSGRMY